MKVVRFSRSFVVILAVLWCVSLYVAYDATTTYVATFFETEAIVD